MKTIIGIRIREIRIASHLTQKQLGKKIFVSQDTISLWELGKALPHARDIIKMCYELHVSADYLLGLKDY